MLVYIQEHRSGAGKWIYKGYLHAFAFLDYEVKYITSLSEVDIAQEYYLMCCDAFVSNDTLKVLERSKKTFLHVQPNHFPKHWGQHPNFVCSLAADLIKNINKLPNVVKWCFGASKLYHTLWDNVHYMPLAFDDINYKLTNDGTFKYDICFIGGVANNGFNEKMGIIRDIITPFLKTSLVCAFAIEQGISQEDENDIICSSKVALNIHDAYQRELGLDTNERTFKSLGLNGLLVSDKVAELTNLFPFVFTSNEPAELVAQTREYCSNFDNSLVEKKRAARELIAKEHSYVKRVEKFLTL